MCRTLSRRGVTLLEMLVAIAIVSVLVGLLLPAVSHMRSLAERTQVHSALRSHGVAFATYAADYRDLYPYFTKPGEFTQLNGLNGGALEHVLFFDAHRTWHMALAPSYYNVDFTDDIFFPGDTYSDGIADRPQYTPIHYACSFIARPGYWNEATRSIDGQFAPTSVAEVAFPSHKSLLVLTWPYSTVLGSGRPLPPLPVCASDGSVLDTTGKDRIAGYRKGDGAEFIEYGAVHFNDSPPMLHTIDGVTGRDIRRGG